MPCITIPRTCESERFSLSVRREWSNKARDQKEERHQWQWQPNEIRSARSKYRPRLQRSYADLMWEPQGNSRGYSIRGYSITEVLVFIVSTTCFSQALIQPLNEFLSLCPPQLRTVQRCQPTTVQCQMNCGVIGARALTTELRIEWASVSLLATLRLLRRAPDLLYSRRASSRDTSIRDCPWGY